MQDFNAMLPGLLVHEGGYVNHPKDPGGITNLGVTIRVWEEWTDRPATPAQIKALTPAVVAPLYRARYWNLLRCDELPPALARCVFDFGVNSGVNRAARYLQRMVGAAEDGSIGPATIAAVARFTGAAGLAEAVRRYQQARRVFYRKRATFPTFGKGWLRRVDEVESEALRLVQ